MCTHRDARDDLLLSKESDNQRVNTSIQNITTSVVIVQVVERKIYSDYFVDVLSILILYCYILLDSLHYAKYSLT